MGTISGSVDIDISDSGTGNPLPYELVSAETLTATSTPGVYTGSATDLGTVASNFTLAVTSSAPSFSPNISLPAWLPDGLELSGTYPGPVAAASVTLEGSLDGTSWYPLTTAGGGVWTLDGSTAIADDSSPGVTEVSAPLARYIRAVVTFTLAALYSVYNNPYTAFTVTTSSITLSVYAAVQL